MDVTLPLYDHGSQVLVMGGNYEVVIASDIIQVDLLFFLKVTAFLGLLNFKKIGSFLKCWNLVLKYWMMIQWYKIIYLTCKEAWYVLYFRVKYCKISWSHVSNLKLLIIFWRCIWGTSVGEKSWGVVTEGLKFPVTWKVRRRVCGRVGWMDSWSIIVWEWN